MSKSYKTLIAVAAVAASMSISTANAGGLFGEGGLIRGDVGKLLDPIENKVLTPVAQSATVAGAAAAGAYVGGELGGVIGAQAGHCINQVFAGRTCAPGVQGSVPQQPGIPITNGQFSHATLPPPVMPGQRVPAALPMPQPLGNYCFTPVGVFGPGPVNPMGSPCHTIAGGQIIWGTVGSF